MLPEVRNRQLLHRDFPAIQPSEIPHEILLGIPLELSLEIYLEMRFEIPLEISLEIFLKYLLEYLSNYLLKYLLKFPFEIPSEIPLELSLEIHLEIPHEIPPAIRAEILLAILHHNKTHPQPPYQALAWSYRYTDEFDMKCESNDTFVGLDWHDNSGKIVHTAKQDVLFQNACGSKTRVQLIVCAVGRISCVADKVSHSDQLFDAL